MLQINCYVNRSWWWAQTLKIESARDWSSLTLLPLWTMLTTLVLLVNQTFFCPEAEGQMQIVLSLQSWAFRTFWRTPILMENLMVIIDERTTGVIGYVRIDKLSRRLQRCPREWKLRESTFSFQNSLSSQASFQIVNFNLRIPWQFLINNGIHRTFHNCSHASYTVHEQNGLAYHGGKIFNFDDLTINLAYTDLILLHSKSQRSHCPVDHDTLSVFPVSSIETHLVCCQPETFSSLSLSTV